MLGCPNCYKTFANELLPTIHKIHNSVKHRGKKPSCDGLDKQLIAEYKNLLAEKESAVLEGRFSDMAELSLQIESLSEELKKRGLL